MKLDLRRSDLAVLVGACFAFVVAGSVVTRTAGVYAPVAIGTAGLFFVLLASLLVFRRIEDRTEEMRTQLEATFSLQRILNPVEPLPAMRGFAMTPASALALCATVRAHEPRMVVETGCGVSSIVIGYLLKAQGTGRVISLEQDETYAKKIREDIRRHGLADIVTIVHAPLVATTVDGATYRWHETTALASLPPIDMVLDDGPPLHLGTMLRYASLPILAPKMAKSAVFFMNFIGAEERTIVDRWLRRFSEFSMERLTTRKGNVILRRGQMAQMEKTAQATRDPVQAVEPIEPASSASAMKPFTWTWRDPAESRRDPVDSRRDTGL